ncbi:hypothetical protein NL676_015788 [Syzygium grande]|nr:hypothetical protein NL676_015788 [Syzygium grande]
MSLVVSGESPAPPSPTPAVVSGLPSIPPRRPSLLLPVRPPPHRRQIRRKPEQEEEILSFRGEKRRHRSMPPRRPETQPPLAPAANADAAKVRSACAAEIEAYLSTMESEQQRRFADK